MHKMGVLVLTFERRYVLCPSGQCPHVSPISETHTHRPGHYFPSASGAQQQNVVGRMEKSCRWRTSWRMPCLKLKTSHTTTHDVFILVILRFFFKSLVKVEWRYSCTAVILSFFKTQTYMHIHVLLKDLTFLMTHVKVLSPDTPHHSGQFRNQKWSVVAWTHL